MMRKMGVTVVANTFETTRKFMNAILPTETQISESETKSDATGRSIQIAAEGETSTLVLFIPLHDDRADNVDNNIQFIVMDGASNVFEYDVEQLHYQIPNMARYTRQNSQRMIVLLNHESLDQDKIDRVAAIAKENGVELAIIEPSKEHVKELLCYAIDGYIQRRASAKPTALLMDRISSIVRTEKHGELLLTLGTPVLVAKGQYGSPKYAPDTLAIRVIPASQKPVERFGLGG